MNALDFYYRGPGQAPVLADLLHRLGRDVDATLALATAEPARQRYAAETARARELGIFGSPYFVCGDEVFWGADRLEDALLWCGAQAQDHGD